MRNLRLVGALLPCVLSCALFPRVGIAAEEDIFDGNTFLDPTDYGADLRADKSSEKKGKFSFSDSQAGYVFNYQDRSLNTDDQVAFASLAHYRYRSAWQYGAKITGIEVVPSSTSHFFDVLRANLSVGHYQLTPVDTGEPPVVSRTQISLTADHYPGRRAEFEVSGDFIASFATVVPGALGRQYRGGINYSYRIKEGPNTWRILYKWDIDLLARDWGGVNCELDFGYENRENHSHATPLNAKVTVARRIGRSMQLDFAVRPNYQFSSRGYEPGVHYEFYIGLHRFFTG